MLISTAIDYTNGSPHIGHAYEKILADVLARYQKLKGNDPYLLLGVDQHGQKVQQTAEAEGVSPAEYSKNITQRFVKLWDALGLDYDGWAETTADLHKATVQGILQKLHDEGQLYKKAYSGFYSVRQEQFLTDKERSEDGEFGPEWGEVTEIEEENWYFKLSEHAEWLTQAVENDHLNIVPAFRKAEVLNAAERAGSTDLCISRPKERLQWGIELPFDPDFVTYVWFDALINYISFAGYGDEREDAPDFKKLWGDLETGEGPTSGVKAMHIIGKDILVPAHAIYWPPMLHAIGLSDAQLPTLLVHGWWNRKADDGSVEKMSKSLGNVIDPAELCEKVGTTAVRYYLMRDITIGKDANFDLDRLVTIYQTELANSIGNLLNRSLNMNKRYREATLQAPAYADENSKALEAALATAITGYTTAMDNYDTAAALREIHSFATAANTYVELSKPWEIAKDEAKADQLTAVLYNLCEACAHLTILLSPIIPEASEQIAGQLNLSDEQRATKLPDLKWGMLPAGHTTGENKPVFPPLIPREAKG